MLYFIGLPDYQEEASFDESKRVLFSKRILAEMLMEVNDYLLIGAKFDLALTVSDTAASKHIESASLAKVEEHFRERIGHYSEWILADHICGARKKRNYYKYHDILKIRR